MDRISRALIVAVVLAVAGKAGARSQVELAWPAREVFQVAVRFIRVDRGCKITDRDPEAGYVTFECEGETSKGMKRGALELIPLEARGRAGVRAQVTIADEPHYVELHFLELLERKIRDERGPPPPAPARPAPPAPPPDAGR